MSRLWRWGRVGERHKEELAEEIQSHLRMAETERVARGEPAHQAAASARRDFGNVGLVQELTRESWGNVWIERLSQDIHFGARMLVRTPGFAAIAVLCLAAGVGANATVFSWMEGVLLRPFPGVQEQDRIVAIAGTVKGTPGYDDMSWLDFKDLERSTPLFSAFIASKIAGATVTGGDRAERIIGQMVSANYFDALGVRPILGRGFAPNEETGRGGHPVTVIGYRLWQDRFAGDPRVIGRTIDFNRVPFTVIGVAPEEFLGTFVGYAMQYWVPASMQGAFSAAGNTLEDRSARWIEGFARLAPGATVAEAQAALTVAAKRLETQFPNDDRGRGVRVLPLWASPFDNAKAVLPMLRIGAVAVLVVLLIACANVANLLLVRSFARRNEMTVRLAIGAGRSRMLRQLATEAALLALPATAVGLLLAYWCRHALTPFFAPRGGVALNFSARFDWQVFAVSAGIGLVSTLLAALGPAIRGSDIDLAAALKSNSRSALGNRSGSGGGAARMRSGLVALQIAMSFVLLAGGGLLFASLRRIEDTSPGFARDGVVTTYVNLFAAGYDTARGRVFADALVDRVRSMGGVESVALGRGTPLDPSSAFGSSPVAVDGYQTAPDEQPTANFESVSPGYFATLGIPMVRGRDFMRSDDDTSLAVAILSQTMSSVYWPGTDPVGKRLRIRGRWRQVVGVVRNIQYESLREPPRPLVFLPLRQNFSPGFALYVKTGKSVGGMGPALLKTVHELDANVPTTEVVSMRERVLRSTSTQQLALALVAVLGSLALLLAAVGLYGVMSFTVSQGSRELGLRIALGAAPSDVLRLVLSRGLTLATGGALAGVVIALGTTRLLGNLLFGVNPRDPVAFGVALAVLLGTAGVSTLVPSWRAARTDPVGALRV